MVLNATYMQLILLFPYQVIKYWPLLLRSRVSMYVCIHTYALSIFSCVSDRSPELLRLRVPIWNHAALRLSAHMSLAMSVNPLRLTLIVYPDFAYTSPPPLLVPHFCHCPHFCDNYITLGTAFPCLFLSRFVLKCVWLCHFFL